VSPAANSNMRANIEKLTAPQQSSFICRIKSATCFSFNWHFHPEYELTLIIRSQGKRFVAGDISDYRDGDLVLIGPNLPHTWSSTPLPNRRARHRACVVQFREDFLGHEFFERDELSHIKRLLRRSVNGLAFSGRARQRAAQKMIGLAQLSPFNRLTQLLEVLDVLARAHNTKTISDPGFVPSLHRAHHRKIDVVCKFLNDHYTHPIKQPQVAEVAGMSPSVFSSFFKKTMGLTFVEYLSALRVSHACRLLIDTDLSIVAVSHNSGFNNLSNFNRRFLRMKKMSPRSYRDQFR
jgi:AraC-like DNA-binding protein